MRDVGPLWAFFVLIVVFVLLIAVGVGAQEVARLQIVRVDTADFPTVRVNLRVEDQQSVPLPISELDELVVRENGERVPDYELTAVPVGVDVVFVVDANATVGPLEDGSRPRWQLVQDTISRFAAQFMSPSGQDRVSIVLPNEVYDNGRFLLQDASDPQAVSDAIGNVMPEAPQATPLQAMVTLALDHLAAVENENGRFQAVFLLTDGAALDQQLDFEALTVQAQQANVPIFSAIIGISADSDEIDNVTRLSDPARGFYVHVPRPQDADRVYLIWQRQANQPQIRYRSGQRVSGPNIVSVEFGDLTATQTFALTLLPPAVTLGLEQTLIQRQGDAPDTPLNRLQPTTISIPVIVTWPDATPRAISDVAWTVNGNPQVPPDLPGANGRFTLNWNVQTLSAGTYELQVAVTDEFDFTGQSEPLRVRIDEERPQPATPTPTPTPAPMIPTDALTALQQGQIAPLLAGAGLIVVMLLLLRFRRCRRTTSSEAYLDTPVDRRSESAPAPAPPKTEGLIPVLVLEDGRFIPLPDDNVTIGRDSDVVTIALPDRSVSRLHARIRWRNGRYWLYDEGSAEGTYLNFERLSLTPRGLNDDDQIQLGRVQLRFRLVDDAELAAFDEEE